MNVKRVVGVRVVLRRISGHSDTVTALLMPLRELKGLCELELGHGTFALLLIGL